MEPHPHTIFIVCHFLLSSASISLSLPFTHPPIEASEIKLSVSNSMHLLQPFNKNKCFLFSLSTVCVAFDGRCSGFGAMGGLGHLTISLYKWIIWNDCPSIQVPHFFLLSTCFLRKCNFRAFFLGGSFYSGATKQNGTMRKKQENNDFKMTHIFI